MISIEAADAILHKWGEMQRAENIGYPKCSFYCDDHSAGYRVSMPAEWEDGRVELTLTSLKANSSNCYHRLKRYYVDGAHQIRISREREQFCKAWDDVDTLT